MVPRDDSIHKNGGASNLNGGFRPSHTPGRLDNPMVNVEPPRREDLQPSYAQTLVGESDQGNHGWYGSMSKYHATMRLSRRKKLTACPQSIRWDLALELLELSPAASAVLTHTSLFPRVMSVWSPSSVDSIAPSIPVLSRLTHSVNASSKSMSRFRSLVCTITNASAH